jgi:iron complex outermembrane recepter protein
MLQVAFRRLILLVIFGLVINPAGAQPCTGEVRGLVEDTDGGILIGATVFIEALDKGVPSDVDGKFLLSGLCAGSYELRITYLGFEDQRITIKIPTSRFLVVKLKPSVKILHDIVIEGQHSQSHSMSQSLGILSDDQIAASRGKPIGEVIQAIPGVHSITTGGSIFKPMIHGLYGQRILILNNGLRQEGQQWGMEHAPEIDTYIASEIEVIKGSEAVRFGADALGGVIIMKAQPLHYLPSVGAELNTSYSTNNRGGSFSGMLEGGFSKNWGWRFQGTLKKGGDYHAPDYNLTNTGMEEADMSIAFGYERNRKSLELFASSFNTEIGILRSAHVGNLTDLQESIFSGRPRFVRPFRYTIDNPRQKVNHHLVKVSARAPWGEFAHIKVVYGLQYDRRKEFDVPRGSSQLAKPMFSTDLISQSMDITVDHEKDAWSASMGVSGAFKDNYNAQGGALLPDYRQMNGGIFIIEKYRKKKWLFEAGIRADFQSYEAWLYDDTELITPRFNLWYFAGVAGSSFYINNASRFSSNFTISNRPPHMSELFSRGLHHSAASIENGLLIRDGQLAGLKGSVLTERSHQWVSTYQFNKRGTSIELSVYGNYFRNYVYISPAGTQLTIRGYFPVFEYRQTDTFLAGGDAFATFDLAKQFSWSSKLSYVFADDRESDSKLPFIPPAQIENIFSFRSPSVGRWRNFFASIRSQASLKQTRAPRTVYPENVTSDNNARSFDFMPAPDEYILFGVEAGSSLALHNRDITISLSVDNIFDTSYRNYLSRLRYYADEPGRNFSIRVNYNFHSHQ